MHLGWLLTLGLWRIAPRFDTEMKVSIFTPEKTPPVFVQYSVLLEKGQLYEMWETYGGNSGAKLPVCSSASRNYEKSAC